MEEKKTLKIGDYYWVALSPYKIFPVQYNADRQDDQWIASEVAYSTKQDAREAMGLGNPIPEEAPVQTMMKEIDWEQRRYEIARDVLAGLRSNPGDLCTPKEFNGNIYAWSIAIADALIKELKKETDGQG